jgi:tetratricopeptide (TPR) repeat protein
MMWLRATVGLMALLAASAIAATLEGTVRDSRGVPLANAVVYLQLNERVQMLTGRTDSEGHYRFSTLQAGTYSLRAAMAGYKDASSGPFGVVEEDARKLDLTLTADEPAFFDEPHFVVAGVADVTNRGGHGSDAVVRTNEALAKAATSLSTAPRAIATETSLPEAEFHHRLGDLDEREEKPLEAVHEYQLAAELEPSEPNLFDWGAELLKHRAAEPAIEVFTKGDRLFPRSVRMKLGLAVAFYMHGSYEEAARRFFEAADLNPLDPVPYLFLGKILNLEIMQPDGFVERFARFAKLQPDNAVAQYYCAASLFRRWKSDRDAATLAQMRSLLEKAVRLDPKLSAAYLQLGILDAEEKNFSDAIACYQKAIRIDPELEEAHYRLGVAYARTGEKLKSQEELDIHEKLAKKSAEDLDRERRDILTFVVSLRVPK